MKKVNTLIIGQGIAGSLAAFMLYRKHIPFIAMDAAVENTSSLVAAGMFTPVSGKRKTIHPLTLQQIPFAVNIYRELETLLNIQLLHTDKIYQVFESANERDEFIRRSVNADFKQVVRLNPEPLPHLKQEFGTAEILSSGWVDCAGFINGFREMVKASGAWIEGLFNYQHLSPGLLMQYGSLQFDNIIFCEGYRAIGNPFFKEENIISCKGDVLTIECNNLPATHIIKKSGLYLVALGNNTYKAGATYAWHNRSEEPDKESRKLIEEKLSELLEHNYVVTDHKSGIRPTTKNREVLCRQHPVHKNMFMLNGLGTKGVIQGPWWANELIEQYY